MITTTTTTTTTKTTRLEYLYFSNHVPIIPRYPVSLTRSWQPVCTFLEALEVDTFATLPLCGLGGVSRCDTGRRGRIFSTQGARAGTPALRENTDRYI